MRMYPWFGHRGAKQVRQYHRFEKGGFDQKSKTQAKSTFCCRGPKRKTVLGKIKLFNKRVNVLMFSLGVRNDGLGTATATEMRRDGRWP